MSKVYMSMDEFMRDHFAAKEVCCPYCGEVFMSEKWVHECPKCNGLFRDMQTTWRATPQAAGGEG